MLRYLLILGMLGLSGCSLLPEIAHQPMVHNPFPQLSKVAIAPFFNLTTEPTVDGRKFAVAYFDQLQSIPGYEVVPVGVVERVMQDNKITLNGPTEARRLATILQQMDIDVLVVGAVTDYTPYYPPRCGLHVAWYATNPCFHAIPPGYGLPWGTPEEEHIPAPLVFEAEMALAKEQLKTQTPQSPDSGGGPSSLDESKSEVTPTVALTEIEGAPPTEVPCESGVVMPADGAMDPFGASLPEGWPDARGFVPPPPQCQRPMCWPSETPVMQQARIYVGNSAEFTEALESFYFFQDDARFGGWQSYLERSDDFIRFCCRMHIWDMLSARGGAGQTRVVWRWPKIR